MFILSFYCNRRDVSDRIKIENKNSPPLNPKIKNPVNISW